MTKINVLPIAPVQPILTLEQKQLLTIQRAKAIADGIFNQMKTAATNGRDLVGANPYGLTPEEVVAAFDVLTVCGFAGWWPKGAALVDFVNEIVPDSIEPLSNPAII